MRPQHTITQGNNIIKLQESGAYRHIQHACAKIVTRGRGGGGSRRRSRQCKTITKYVRTSCGGGAQDVLWTERDVALRKGHRVCVCLCFAVRPGVYRCVREVCACVSSSLFACLLCSVRECPRTLTTRPLFTRLTAPPPCVAPIPFLSSVSMWLVHQELPASPPGPPLGGIRCWEAEAAQNGVPLCTSGTRYAIIDPKYDRSARSSHCACSQRPGRRWRLRVWRAGDRLRAPIAFPCSHSHFCYTPLYIFVDVAHGTQCVEARWTVRD